MRTLPLLCLALMPLLRAHAAEPCQTFRGRAVMYLADGQMRIWNIATHHEFEPADKASWDRLGHYMDDPVTGQANRILFADFTVCPTAPLVNGAVQPAIIKRISHPHVLTEQQWQALQSH